jgi:hypothetical protein
MPEAGGGMKYDDRETIDDLLAKEIEASIKEGTPRGLA